jgi:hypothetical protein
MHFGALDYGIMHWRCFLFVCSPAILLHVSRAVAVCISQERTLAAGCWQVVMMCA